MDDGDTAGPSYDPIVDEFATYEDYLDSQVTATDMYYLEDVELARQLVELGIRGNGEVIKRAEFLQRQEVAEAARVARMSKKPKKLHSEGKRVEGSPLLQALKDREEAVRTGRLTTIIFLRDRNAGGQEVSGYIDYGQRLRTENMEPYFDRKRKLTPKPSDLSFYNWSTHTSASNPTPNFQVIADHKLGLLFKNKKDRKVINVDPASAPGDNSTRTELETEEYMHVVLYDHVTRRRG